VIAAPKHSLSVGGKQPGKKTIIKLDVLMLKCAQ